MSTAANSTMNALIRAGAGRGERREGLMDRMSGTGPLGDERDRRLNEAMAAYEDAARRGDEVARELADQAIESVLTEARGARLAAEEAERQQAGPTDGGAGVRGKRPPPVRDWQREESSAQLIARAFSTRRQERAERNADERTIIANS
jgi:hypothetical protein